MRRGGSRGERGEAAGAITQALNAPMWRNQCLPGGRYAFDALAALSAIVLNSAPVQALVARPASYTKIRS